MSEKKLKNVDKLEKSFRVESCTSIPWNQLGLTISENPYIEGANLAYLRKRVPTKELKKREPRSLQVQDNCQTLS
jgi:hypothetical protein